MKRSIAELQGVSGMAPAIPDQGAQMAQPPRAGETVEQSCPTDSSGRSTQFRIRLPARHAARWLRLPPKLREQVAGIVFGTFTAGTTLEELVSVGSELRETRIAIINALQFALARGASLDAKRIDAAVQKIDQLLGGRRP
jgi:hypothetical protein